MEFTDSILNHNKAIQLIEGLTAPYDPNPLNPKLKDVISGLSLTNIAEIHFQTGNLEVI